MKCSHCHQPLEDNATFCTECGTRRPTDHRCIHCGEVVKAGQKFCGSCGKSPELLCSHCGANLKAGQKFCKRCGKKVQQESSRLSCSHCGAPAEENCVFCTHCGHCVAGGPHSLPTSTVCSEGLREVEHNEKGNEDMQVWTETADVSNEQMQASSEQAQASSEQKQATTEQAQASNEQTQASNEQTQASTEQTQASGEQNQASNEQRRASSEQTQTSTEQTQASGEQNQVSSEQTQATTEQVQASSEQAQASTEQAQASTEQAQASTEQAQVSSEQTQAATEQVSSEQTQASNEHTQASDEQTQASSEQTQASSEQTQASSEQTQASSEQTQASSEQTQASSEQTQVANEQTQASSEQTQASNEQRQASGEQTQASNEQRRASSEQTQTSTEQTQASGEQNQASNEQTQVSSEQTQASGEQTQASTEQAQASSEQTQASGEQAQASSEQTQASSEQTQRSSKQRQTSSDPAHISDEQAKTLSDPKRSSVTSATNSQMSVANPLMSPNTSNKPEGNHVKARSEVDSDPCAGRADGAVAAASASCHTATDGTAEEQEGDSCSAESEDEDSMEEEGEEQGKEEGGIGAEVFSSGESSQKKGPTARRDQRRRQASSRKKHKKRTHKQAERPKLTTRVIFHVVISSKFKHIEANKHHVFLSWTPDASKPSRRDGIEMIPTGRCGEGGRLYEADVEASRFEGNKAFKYKYCVELDGQWEWEKVYFLKDCNVREFRLPLHGTLVKGPWHIFDWMAYPSGIKGRFDVFKRWFPGVISSRDIFFNDLSLSCSLFLPTPETVIDALNSQVQKVENTAEKILHAILVLLRSAANNINFIDVHFIEYCVGNVLLSPLLQQLERNVHEEKPTVVLAIFLLHLADLTTLNLLLEHEYPVFKALLIKPDLEKNTCPDITQLRCHFPMLTAKRDLLWKKWTQWVLKNPCARRTCWIYTIPLMHLLTGQCRPFVTLPPNEDHRDAKWWGTYEIAAYVNDFKNTSQHSWCPEAATVVHMNLSAAFQADPLMLRTLVALMSLDQVLNILSIGDFPAEITMASLFFHLHTVPQACKNRYKDIVHIVRSTAQMVGALIRSTEQPAAQDMKYYTMLGAICEDLLKEVTETHRCEDVVIQAVVLLQLSIVTMLGRQNQCNLARNDVIIHQLFYSVKLWFKNSRCNNTYEWETLVKFIEECLEISEGIPNKAIAEQLKALFFGVVKDCLNKLDPTTRLLACVKLMEREDSLNSVVEQDVHIYLEQALTEDMHKIEHELQSWGTHNTILQSCLFNLCQKKWSKRTVQSREDQLKLLFLWKPMVIFLRSCIRDRHGRHWMSKEVAEKVEQTQKFLQKLKNGVINGDVLISDIVWLTSNDHSSRFHEVVQAVTGEGNQAESALKLRQKELETFQDVASEVNCLLRFCQTFITTDDMTREHEEFQGKTGNLDEKKMSHICGTPAKPCSVEVNEYKPIPRMEAVPERFRPYLPQLKRRMNSAVYQNMLKKTAGAMNIAPESKFWEVLVSAWHDAEDEWTRACEAMRGGQITVEEADRLFEVIEKNDDKWREKCKQEMQNMCGDGPGDWVDQRMQQFLCLSKMKTQREAACVLCCIKEEFGFSGDVENIRSFQEVDLTQPIGQLEHSVVGTSEALQDIDSNCVRHFRQFGSQECSKFVNWVRETMAGDGMKELKVFVDLALNYVGDDPREMDKIRNLRAVITGYAPLIFQSSSQATFLERCCEVARNIRADKDLPAKLESTVSLVQWFDSIHKFHGAVEKTAMAQVDSITSRGILKVGRLQQPAHTGRGLGVSDVMCLEVATEGEEEEDTNRTYSYQDLLDLQSRLMLVVGPEDQDRTSVDRFISVMDSVVRLVGTYLQLCESGCLLFLNWMVKFFFDQSRGICCIIEFLHEDNIRRLKGVQNVQQAQTLEHYMAMVAHFLDSSYDNWQSYVAQTRKKYVDLNVFTMDQLVFFQEQLAVKECKDISAQVFPLLSLLNVDCSAETLKTAVQQAADMMEDMRHSPEDDEADNEEAKQVAVFIQKMEDNGFSRQAAVKALKDGVHPSDEIEGITWCMKYKDENEEEEKMAETEEAKHANLSASTTTLNASMLEGTIATALQLLDAQSEHHLSLDAVRSHLGNTWSLFLERVTFSAEDYLSLHHIGCVFTVLTQENILQVDRKLPPPMSTDSPSLIICPKSEILKTVTSLYMFTKEAPLPGPDEVLLCTGHTTTEQISMFCHRAFSGSSSQQGKIHCLAFADLLHYEVGQFAERELKEFINTAQHPYQLVVVCTEENEFNSGLTASLERYIRPAPVTAADTDTMASYFRSKFTVSDDLEPLSAAHVEPDRLCVRIVRSTRSGMGKTLYVKRLACQLKSLLEEEAEEEEDSSDEDDEAVHVTVPLYEKHVNIHDVAATLLHRVPPGRTSQPRIIHLDVAYEVQEGVDHLLYSLLILSCVTDIRGHVWRRSMLDLYLVEAMPLLEHSESKERKMMHEIFSILPSTWCLSPLAVLKGVEETAGDSSRLLFDKEEYKSEVFQRPFHYLRARNSPGDPEPFIRRKVRRVSADMLSTCLETLLKHCGVRNPSWAELHHFVSFLNKQLKDFEHSIFCSPKIAQDWPGFPAFVLKFLIHMSRDFATRSLSMSETPLPVLEQLAIQEETEGIEQFQVRRTWESSAHPYIFFNPDRCSMTFLGFTVDPRTGNLLNQAGKVLQAAIMKRSLYHTLAANGAPLSEDFDSLGREEKLLRLYQVMGVPEEERRTKNGKVVDPDDTYELTTDNAKKILAIYMRFRCDIPVLVMGETGCGKTRLVQFLCALQTPKSKNAQTMVIMKVHGGTTSEDIHKKVKEAEILAKETKKQAAKDRPLYTVLFFDEANTTEAIGAVKEVMCDGALNGTRIQLHNDLKMVAACNPYRKHSKTVIERLEKAGLGYHVSAEKTCDKLGRVPMRQLVYRVQPLPQSMLPLVWDFGQLSSNVEHMYIAQMVRRYERKQLLGDLTQQELITLTKVLVECQAFMRNLKDECSFVSLRDADRALLVTGWFLKQTELLRKIEEDLGPRHATSDITKSLILALSVCYRAGLPEKKKFEDRIGLAFLPSFNIRGSIDFGYILDSCQDVLLREVKLGEKIARNQALKENVFMMVVCVELRIPLFLVGKPGSSKSLAKTIVADAMQGQQLDAKCLFSTLKEVQMVSFQCSPLATADSILTTFRQCAQLQQDKDRDKFVAVAVLDEVGLAEDSPHMPLKALHPLLEDGYEVQESHLRKKWGKDQQQQDEDETYEENGDFRQQQNAVLPVEEYVGDSDEEHELQEEEDQEEPDSESDLESIEEKPDRQNKTTRLEKVAFIGISNWALDPAKMNRGILVQRDVPDKEELVKTAISICQSGGGDTEKHVVSLVHKLAEAYLEVFNHDMCKREFFGLRDFYSLVKMVHATAVAKERKVTKLELQAAVRRNFGGLLDLDPVKIFECHLERGDVHTGPVRDDMDSSYPALLRLALSGQESSGESRYLLLLTENYGGLHILTDNLLSGQAVEPIFGSSFPRDQEYTQICRNINRIKICMETGKTVILLNLDNLYESLYDALNQYYSYLAKARYVDLGLGTHRVKCKVDTKFRLIVVAEKQTVYDKFPIPLINRLEKHFLTVNSLLSQEQQQLEQQLQHWVTEVVQSSCEHCQLDVNGVWIGHHRDMAASLVLTVWQKYVTPSQPLTPDLHEKILTECKKVLLWCATPDAVIRAQDEWCSQVYFQEQQHDSLAQFLQVELEVKDNSHSCLMAQVTTHSKLLTEIERGELDRQLAGYRFTLLSLQAFHTEQQFRHQLSLFLSEGEIRSKVLLIQCERGQANQSLLQCAQYCVQSMWAHRQYQHVAFLVQLPRVASTPFSGYIGGNWLCVHVDDLRNPTCQLPSVSQLQAASPAKLLASSLVNCVAVTSERQDREEEQTRLVPDGLSLDLVRRLLAACIQSAVARIRDEDTSRERATQRIALILQWLERGESMAFLQGMLQMVCAVMQKKEEEALRSESTAFPPADWLTRRAAHPNSIAKAGTLRRAWMQCLEQEVVPVLAGLLAYLDTNHNLDLLQSEGWLLDLWLQVLNTPDLCQLHYSHLQLLSSHLREFPCHSIFTREGADASPSLPFSWLLWETIEAYLTHTAAQEKEDSVVEAVEKSEVGRFLPTVVVCDDIAQDFVDRYLKDLVYRHFRIHPAQHQLLVQCMKQALGQASVAVQAYRLSGVLVRVHQVMISVYPRLQALLDMTACHPNALQNLQEGRQNLALRHPELVEDILLLKILAQELTPQNNQLNTEEGCQQWLYHFNILAPVLSGVLDDADMHCIVNRDLFEDAETRLDRNGKQWFSYGPWCCDNIAAVRCLWTRVMTVKLFIDYMSALGRGAGSIRVEPVNYNLLWTILTDEANMKTQKTLRNVDSCLKHANTQMVKHLLGDVGNCTHCQIKLQGPPTELPCGHRLCNKCYTQEVRIHHSCPECHKAVPDDFEPDSSGCCDREKVERLVSFQQHTSAFLMAVVSQLAFGGLTPPEPDAVEHIFSYIVRRVEGVATIQTQQLTLRDDQMDPSPVLRSFILRLLLKHSEEEVSEHIRQFLDDARQMIHEYMRDDNRQSLSVLKELSLLIIHCVENLEHEREVKGVADGTLGCSFPERCSRVKESLHQMRLKLESTSYELSTLTALGQLRYALSMCASVLHSHVVQAAEGGYTNPEFKNLLMEAAIICTMGNTLWPKLFLVKHLCREFGTQAYLTLMQQAETQPVLRWLKLEEGQESEAVPDRYLLCGPEYRSIREEIASQLRRQDEQHLSCLNDCGLSAEQQQYCVMLALHREVPMALVIADQNTQMSLTERAVGLIQSGSYPLDQDFAQALVRNSLGVAGSWLRVGDHHSLAEQSLVCIITHFWLALRSSRQQRHLLASFVALIQQPDVMKNSYLPTMPQDNMEDIIRAMNIDHTKTIADYNRGVEIPKLWECPKGHRYAIGDCGRPNSGGSCPECGVPIGGVDYNDPAEGNQISQMKDRTQPGHILGAAQDRSEEAMPERSMSAAACSVVRFFTHAALFLSAAQPGQAATVSTLIRPALREEDVKSFLWAHLNKDLAVMQKALGRCCDDIYLLLHHLCHHMALLPPDHFWGPQLRSKQDRENWERGFTDKYIQPVLQQAETIIQTGNDLLLSDTGKGQKQLLNVVFEVGEEDQDFEMEESIQCTPAAWKYRLRITVEHFFREFRLLQPDQQDDLPVLKLFLQESHHLRALHFVPDILALQRRLLQKLHHRLSRVEAISTPIKERLDTKEGPDLQKLVAVFSKAWNIVRDLLINYRCYTEEGDRVWLPEEFHTAWVGEDSPVGMVLPDTQGPGRCAYLLLHYLLVQHNHFLTLYCPHTRHSFEKLPEVPLAAVNARHLVSYSPEADLLPLVLLHCNYSLHLGHRDTHTSATQLHYDFQGFELQLQNTLLLSKSRVCRLHNGAMQIETLTYSADSSTSRLVSMLRNKIPQEPLDIRVQRQVISELGENLEDLCCSIDSVNTALTLLRTVQVSADQFLHSFMMVTLKMRDTEGIHSLKAQQYCRLKHVQCLWLLLCSQRARLLAMHNQEAFDKQGPELRRELSEEQETEVNSVLARLSPDRVELILNHMYQCIMLRLLPQSHDQEFAHPDNYNLKWLLEDSVENPPYTQPQVEQRQAQEELSVHEMESFPPSILASQIIPCWTYVLKHLKARRQ